MEGGAIRWLSLWIKQKVSSTLWITSFFTVIYIVWIMASSLEIGQCNWWYYFQVSRLTSHQIMYPSTTFMITASEIVQCLKSPFLAQCTEAELRWGKRGFKMATKNGVKLFLSWHCWLHVRRSLKNAHTDGELNWLYRRTRTMEQCWTRPL